MVSAEWDGQELQSCSGLDALADQAQPGGIWGWNLGFEKEVFNFKVYAFSKLLEIHVVLFFFFQ